MKSVYLAGSMSDLPNMGARWRADIQEWLESRGQRVFNPCEMEKGVGATPDWDALRQTTQEAIIRVDLDQVCHKSRYIICYYTRQSQGTVAEIVAAYYHDNPIYFVTRKKLTGWVGTISRACGNKVFKNFKQLKTYLAREYGYRKQGEKVRPGKSARISRVYKLLSASDQAGCVNQ